MWHFIKELYIAKIIYFINASLKPAENQQIKYLNFKAAVKQSAPKVAIQQLGVGCLFHLIRFT